MTIHHPETGAFGDLLGRAGAALDAHFAADLGDPIARADTWREQLTGPLPTAGVGTAATIDELLEIVLPNGPRMVHPRFWSWITTGPTTVPAVAAAVANVASPQRYLATAFNLLEEQSLAWLADLCGLGPHMEGVYSSGGSTANLVALGAARQWALAQDGRDGAAEGLDGRPLAIYASEQTHHTIQRSAGVLGIGRRNVRMVAVDAQQRMIVDALTEHLERDVAAGVRPVAVVAVAGTTNTGAIDPLRAIGNLAHAYGAWFHVDGAYGLPGILDPRLTAAFDGLDLADSVIVDPHKWLGAPVGTAATFVRDRAVLFDAFTQEPADYLQGASDLDDIGVSLDTFGIPYGDFGVELSAPARGVQVWSILRELGREGMQARIVHDNDLARRVEDLADLYPQLEVLSPATLSICCFRYAPDDDRDRDLDALNRTLLRRLRRETDFMPSSTLVRGQYALRPCFINARTVPADVEAFIAAVVTIGDDLAASGHAQPSGR